MARSFGKDPDAVKDYQWDWSAWLGGDTITAHTITAPAGLTVDSSNHTGTAVTAWLSDGAAGAVYEVTCHIVTAAGREDDRTMLIVMGEQ